MRWKTVKTAFENKAEGGKEYKSLFRKVDNIK